MKKLLGTISLSIIVLILYLGIMIAAGNIGKVQAQIEVLNNDVNTVAVELAQVESSAASATSELSSIIEENKKIEAGDKHNLRISSFKEVKDFLAIDLTDTKTYMKDGNRFFARDLTNAAKEEGLRCAVVAVIYSTGRNTYVVAFETADSGTIFIDPATDRVLKVTEGGHFCSDNNILGCDSNDTIVDILIYW